MTSKITPPEYVYVPADDYSISVDIRAPETGAVNEWIPLRATRKSGPWKRIKYAEVSITDWHPVPPPAFEEEVADNLFWIVDPPGFAELDVTPVFSGHVRAIRFSAPGVYKLWAQSIVPTKGTSNVVTIAVGAVR